MPIPTPSSPHRAPPLPRILLALVAAAGASIASPASAPLGAPESSALADAAVLRGAAQAESRVGYRVTSVTLPSGTVLKEFSSAEGTVFAVTWRGMRPPDLSQVLGSYYPELQAAQAQRTTVNHAHLRLDTGRMVFESAGHMRDLRGSAYVASLVPAGVKVEDLQ